MNNRWHSSNFKIPNPTTGVLLFVVALFVGCLTPEANAFQETRSLEKNIADDETAKQEFVKQMKPFFVQYCIQCHGEDQQESGVRFDKLSGYQAKDSTLWTKIHEAVASGEMPPDDQAQPRNEHRAKALAWIRTSQRMSRSATTRRLNRREMSAALRMLTGLNVDYESMLPADGQVDGFDTGADGLQDAADSIQRMMIVTRRAVDAIRFLEPPGEKLTANFQREKNLKQDVDRWWKQNGYRVKPKGYELKTKGILLSPTWLGSRDQTSVEIPAQDQRPTGVARLTMVVSRAEGLKGIPFPHLNMSVRGQRFEINEITGTLANPQTLIFDIQLDELPIEKNKIRFGFRSLVELPYEVTGFANDTRTKSGEPVPPGTKTYRPVFDKKKIKNPLEHPVPFTLLQQMTFEPNYVAAWPPKSLGDFGKLTDADSIKVLMLWMERAWRRPVSAKEIIPFSKFYKKLRSEGMTFDEAMRATFQSVLLSAPFRFHASPGDRHPRVAQYAMASRLSFMLHGAPPDFQLRLLAKLDKLKDPNTLDAQVDRLIASPGSIEFFRPFVSQWLEIGQPITIAMRSIKNQDFRFGRHLRDSMREETISYVRQMFVDNRPLRELVDSDWTMMNNILADFYGYQPLPGKALRKVEIRKDDPRGGGILGHGGIQSMLTWMGDNWVIYRGAWTMRHILDDPPPTPPLEVPELDHADGSNKGKTIRQLLAQHQEEPNCAVCHRKMDPVGFAFQNFDLSGRWRNVAYEQYVHNELDGKVEWYGKGKSRPLDTKGTLPRGEKFESFAEFKRLLAKKYVKDMARGLMKKLVLYGTGRRPDIDDLAEIDSILESAEKSDFRVRDLLKALIRSRVFLE